MSVNRGIELCPQLFTLEERTAESEIAVIATLLNTPQTASDVTDGGRLIHNA